MPWNKGTVFRAIVTISDVDLGKEKPKGKGVYKTPLTGGYKSGFLRPTMDIDGYLTSAMIEFNEPKILNLDDPVHATVSVLLGNADLEIGKTYNLVSGYRRIGWAKVISIQPDCLKK